jgi:hypothetical protein
MKRRQITQIAVSLGLITSVAGCSSERTSSTSETDTDNDGVPDEHDYAPTDPDVQSKSDTESRAEPEPRWTAYNCDEGEFKFQIEDVTFDDRVMSVVVKNITTSPIEIAKVVAYYQGGSKTEEFDLDYTDYSYPVVGTYDTIGIDCDLYYINEPDDIEYIEIWESISDTSDTTCS